MSSAEERERKRAEIEALGDVTDPKNNPLIPNGRVDLIDPMLTPEGNEMIPADGEAAAALRQSTPKPAPAENVPDRPSVEFVTETVRKFLEGSTAAEYERVRTALKL